MGVTARLQEFFADKQARAKELSPRAPELVSAVEDLTMRGGKRLRPLAIYAGFRATTPHVSEFDWQATLTLGAAIELLRATCSSKTTGWTMTISAAAARPHTSR